MNNETNTTTVTAPDITCGGCANAIKNAFGRVEGVEQVDVDVATKQVTVRHGGGIDKGTIVDVLDKAGFPAS
jgi:copper chaperone CopZ